MMTEIRIVTLNVGAASKERARRIVDEWIKPSEYDVFVFTETSEGEGTALISSEFTEAGWCVVRRDCEPNDRGVAVVSRIQIQQATKYPTDDPARGRAVVLELDTAPCIELVGMYVPNRGNDPTKTGRKRSYLETWLHWLSSVQRDRPRVLLGDLNVVPLNQHPRFLPQQQFEYDYYEALAHRCRLYDAALRHNATGHEDTWVASSNEGYTYDHIFVDTLLDERIRGFRYDHSTRRKGGITDHSAVSVVIAVDSVSHLNTYKIGTPRQGGLF